MNMNNITISEVVSRGHPVIAILGDVEVNLPKVIDELRGLEVAETDLKVFEITKDKLREVENFLLLAPKRIKVAVCLFKSMNDNVVSGMLKKIEDVPKKVCFILLAENLPDLLLNRSIVIEKFALAKEIVEVEEALQVSSQYIDAKFSDNIDKDNIPAAIMIWLEKAMLRAIRQGGGGVGVIMNPKNTNPRLALGYQIWNKFIEVEYWLNSKQINSTAATEMMLAILMAARFRKS